MKYQIIRELTPESLLIKSEEGQSVIFDRVEFPVTPKESFRLELQKELKEIIQREKEIQAEGLIKYTGLEKYEGQLYLVRDVSIKKGLDIFQNINPEPVCNGLLQVLKLFSLYHQQGLFLNGLSRGQLRQDQDGHLYVQDPLVMGYLSKSLTEDYQVATPAEVIKGKAWEEKSDLFCWGVLAYQLLSGVAPFLAATPDERFDKILHTGVAVLRDVRPEISEELSQLVMECLNSDPRKRPTIEEVYTRLTILLTEKRLTVSETEAANYAGKAIANRQRYQTKEHLWSWFRKYGFITFMSLGIILFLIFTWVGSKSKPVITAMNKPMEVLSYYFEGVKTLNVTLMDETIYHAKNSFSDMVTNLYVMNKAQQGINYSTKDYITLDFINLKVIPISENYREAKYRVSYTLQVTLAKEIQYFERIDEITLQPIRKVWRITKIDILKSSQHTETVPDPTTGV